MRCAQAWLERVYDGVRAVGFVAFKCGVILCVVDFNIKKHLGADVICRTWLLVSCCDFMIAKNAETYTAVPRNFSTITMSNVIVTHVMCVTRPYGL